MVNGEIARPIIIAGIIAIGAPIRGSKSMIAANIASGAAKGMPSIVSPIKIVRPQMSEIIKFPRMYCPLTRPNSERRRPILTCLFLGKNERRRFVKVIASKIK